MFLLVATLQFPPMQNFPEVNRPGTYADLRGSVERACGITTKTNVKTMLDREFKAAWDVHGSNVVVRQLKEKLKGYEEHLSHLSVIIALFFECRIIAM